MTNHLFSTRSPIKWLMLWGIATAVGLTFALQFFVSSSSFGNPVTWRHALAHSLADWYCFGLLSIPAIGTVGRFPLEREKRARRALAHLAASIVFSFAWTILRAHVAKWQAVPGGEPVFFGSLFSALLAKTFYFNVFVYWVIVSVTHAVAYYQKYHDREIRELELEKRLAQARLEALQIQLNPHFLFNTLHAISALMHKDVESADKMMVRLSDLLRYALDSTRSHEVPLRQELAFLEKYLEIEETRFGDRLHFKKDVASETLDAKVPNLVLQPLVENAIRHGIEPHARPGQIVLFAKRIDNRLNLTIRDSGAGLIPDRSFREGIGLANTRARLEHLYGLNHTLEFEKPPDGGFEITISIPFQSTADAAA